MYRILRIVALFLLAGVALPTPAAAHLRLQSSSPAQGDTVRTSLTEIRVVFSQAVEPRYTVLTLLDNMGNALELGTLEPVGEGKTHEFVYRLQHPVVAGDFVVHWRTAGEDGHVVNGSFDFSVDVPGSVRTTADPTPTRDTAVAAEETHGHEQHHIDESQIEPLYQAESTPWILSRWLNFVGLVLMVGAVAFRFAVVQRAAPLFADDVVSALDGATRNLALIAAIIALVGNAGRLWLQSGALHGSERMWDPGLLRMMILEMGWGKAWLAQTVAALAFIVATRIRSEQPLESWIAAALFAFVAAATPAFSGHAAAVEQMAVVPIVNDAVHLIAAAAWLGTLAVLLFAGVPAIIRASHQPFADAAATVRVFSPLALFAAAVAIATGAMSAFVHIKAISELWTTPYGKTLSIKLGVVLLTATTGAYNWKVVSPRLGTEASTLHIRRSALAEIIIAATILAVTAVLVALPLH